MYHSESILHRRLEYPLKILSLIFQGDILSFYDIQASAIIGDFLKYTTIGDLLIYLLVLISRFKYVVAN